jgi:hypothetical protein
MREKIQEIIQENYNKFLGTNEAELHASVEIEEFFKKFLSDFETKIHKKGVEEGLNDLTNYRILKINELEKKLEKAKEFINYCKSQPDVYVHANKCLTEIE